jgi:hypothetical protein
MKKLLFAIFVTITIMASAQTKTWEWTYEVDNPIDTVLQPGKTWDLSNYSWTGTIVTEGLTDTLIIGIGSSNVLLRSTPSIQYAIENFATSGPDFPYNFIPANQMLITVNDTTYQQSWDDDLLNFKSIGVTLKTTGDTIFTVKGYFKFTQR